MVGLVWYRVQMFEDVNSAPTTAMEHRNIQMHLQGTNCKSANWRLLAVLVKPSNQVKVRE
jgi:hypothetical protein